MDARRMTRLPAAQHAWEATFATDDEGRPVAPRFHRLLMLEVTGSPTAADARHLETALGELERRFAYGPDGLLTCLGWGAGWFERHTQLASPVARPLPMARWEDPILEDIDVCLHLASDDEARLAAVSDELFGPGPLDQRARLTVRDLRTGFVGRELPAERLPTAGIPADAHCCSASTPDCAATRPPKRTSPFPTVRSPAAPPCTSAGSSWTSSAGMPRTGTPAPLAYSRLP
jgi:hypothetical protein